MDGDLCSELIGDHQRSKLRDLALSRRADLYLCRSDTRIRLNPYSMGPGRSADRFCDLRGSIRVDHSNFLEGIRGTPLPGLFSRYQIRGSPRRSKRGVSELYATLLMLGVTMAFGGSVTGLAVAQFGQSSSSVAMSSSNQADSAQRQLSLINAVTSQPGTCPSYRGTAEGTSLGFAVFDYGSSSFAPTSFAINGSIYAGTYSTLAPGGMIVYNVALLPHGSCAHATGQTLLMLDASGDEFQFVS